MRLKMWGSSLVVVLSLAACGGDGTDGAGSSTRQSSATREVDAPDPTATPGTGLAPEELADAVRDLPGDPLPKELVGSYEEDAAHLGKTILWELLPAGHELCVELVETEDSCITWRDTFDKFESPAAYGAASVRGGRLILSYVDDRYSKECWGSKGVYDYEMKGDRLYFHQKRSVGPCGSVVGKAEYITKV